MENSRNEIRVIICEPSKAPYVAWIKNDINTINNIVGGGIDLWHIKDDIVLVVNDVGKIIDLPFNRCLYSNDHEKIIDIIQGTFFVCYVPKISENFCSIPDELLAKYMQRFSLKEKFVLEGNLRISIDPYGYQYDLEPRKTDFSKSDEDLSESKEPDYDSFLLNNGINGYLVSQMSEVEKKEAYEIEDYDKYNDYMTHMATKYDI